MSKKSNVRATLTPRIQTSIQTRQKEQLNKKPDNLGLEHLYHKEHHENSNYSSTREIKTENINAYTKKTADRSDIFIPQNVSDKKRPDDIIDLIQYLIENSSFAKFFKSFSNNIDQQRFVEKIHKQNETILKQKTAIIENFNQKSLKYHKDINILSEIRNGNATIDETETCIKDSLIFKHNIINLDDPDKKNFILPQEDNIPITWFISKGKTNFILKITKNGKNYNSRIIVDKNYNERPNNEPESGSYNKKITHKIILELFQNKDILGLNSDYVGGAKKEFEQASDWDFSRLKDITGENTIKSLLIRSVNNYKPNEGEPLPKMLRSTNLSQIISHNGHIDVNMYENNSNTYDIPYPGDPNTYIKTVFDEKNNGSSNNGFFEYANSEKYIPIDDKVVERFSEAMSETSKYIDELNKVDDNNRIGNINIISRFTERNKNIKPIIKTTRQSLALLFFGQIIAGTIVAIKSTASTSIAPMSSCGILFIAYAMVGTVLTYLMGNFYKHRFINAVEKQKIVTDEKINTAIKTIEALHSHDNRHILALHQLKNSFKEECHNTKKDISMKPSIMYVLGTIVFGMLSTALIVTLLSSLSASALGIGLTILLVGCTMKLANISLQKISKQIEKAEGAMTTLNNSCAANHKIIGKFIESAVGEAQSISRGENGAVLFHQTPYITMLNYLREIREINPKDKDIENFIEKFSYFINRTDLFQTVRSSSINSEDEKVLKSLGINIENITDDDNIISKIFGTKIPNDIYKQFINAGRCTLASVYLQDIVNEKSMAEYNYAKTHVIEKLSTCSDDDILRMINGTLSQYQNSNISAKQIGIYINQLTGCNTKNTEDTKHLLDKFVDMNIHDTLEHKNSNITQNVNEELSYTGSMLLNDLNKTRAIKCTRN